MKEFCVPLVKFITIYLPLVVYSKSPPKILFGNCVNTIVPMAGFEDRSISIIF